MDTTGSTSSPGEHEPEEPGQEERLDSSTPVEPGPNASADLPAPADVSEEDTVAATPAIPPADETPTSAPAEEAPASPDMSEEDTRTDVPMAAPADWVPELPPPAAAEPLGDGATQPWYPDEADTELLPPIFDTAPAHRQAPGCPAAPALEPPAPALHHVCKTHVTRAPGCQVCHHRACGVGQHHHPARLHSVRVDGVGRRGRGILSVRIQPDSRLAAQHRGQR